MTYTLAPVSRGEWHKGEDRAAVRAKLWTGDLLRALDGELDSALPYSSPGSSPPPQPATPPLPGTLISYSFPSYILA